MLQKNKVGYFSKRKETVNYFVLLFISFLLYVLSIYLIDDLKFYSFEKLSRLSFLLNWVGILLFCFVIYSWYRLNRKLFEPYIIFWVFFFVFNYGQCTMWAFGIHMPMEIGTRSPYGINLSIYDVVRAQIVTCLGLLVFHTGAMYSILRSKWNKVNVKEENISNENKLVYPAIRHIGIFLAIISFVPTFYRSIQFLSVAQKYGYASLYYSNLVDQGGLLMILEMFFFPAILCLLIGGGFKQKIRYFSYVIFALYALINLLSGDRGSWIYKLLVLIWLHSKYVKKITIKKAILYIVSALIGIHILYVIVVYRNIGINNITWNAAFDLLFYNQSPIIYAFFELGGSMSIIAMVISCDISSSWMYGNTYFTALIGVISTRLINMFGLPVVLVDDWLAQEYLGISWGTGFSMIGEAYFNGGMLFAPLYLLVLGVLLGRVLSLNELSIQWRNPLKYFFVASSLQTWIGFSRGSSYLYFKTWFWGTFVVFVCIKLLVRIRSKYLLNV